MQFAASVVIACTVFALLGSALWRRSPVSAWSTPFTSIYLGQMIAWAGAVLLLPVGAGLERVLGVSPPIGAWLFLGLAAALWSNQERLAKVREAASSPSWIIGLLGLLSVIQVALVYSSAGSHVGALGLDTHQHIYWTRQLLSSHRVPLVERGTDILTLYPHGFHLLTALWAAAGVGGGVGEVGPWVKLMPFLQAWLPCVAFAELACAKERRSGTALLLGAALAVYAFAITRMVFPEHDLSGTPRYASAAAMLFPWMAVFAGRQLEDARLGAIGLASIPAVAALLLSLNAIVAVQFFVFVVPLLAVTLWLDRSSRAQLKAGLLAGSCGLALLVSLQDPWIVAQWSSRLAPGYVEWFGAISPERAAELGMLSQDELVEESPGARLYDSGGDYARLFATSLSNGLRDTLTSGWQFPFRHAPSNPAGRIALRILVAAALVAVILRRRKGDGSSLLVALGVGCVIGAFGQHAFFHFSEGLAVGRDHAFVLLRDYSDVASRHTALPLAAMLMLGALDVLARELRDPAWLDRRIVLAATGVVCALPFLLHGATETVDPERGFWAPVAKQDIADLREIEAHVAAEQGVLVPAAAWGIGEERWIVPRGATASVLPWSERRLVFNARLGSSVFYNWRDVARFCDGRDEDRADFLERNGVEWFLWKRPVGVEADRGPRNPMCKLPLSRLGVFEPPVAAAGDLQLYRIDPARLRGVERSQR